MTDKDKAEKTEQFELSKALSSQHAKILEKPIAQLSMAEIMSATAAWFAKNVPAWLLHFVTIRILLGALIFSGFITMFSFLATYIYSLTFGLRLPIEGVPFLFLFVFVCSISISIVGTFFMIISSFFTTKFDVINKFIEPKIRKNIIKGARRYVLLFSGIFIMLSLNILIIYILSVFANIPFLLLFILMIMFTSISLIKQSSPEKYYFLQYFCVIVISISLAALLFNPNVYSSILRIIKVGGGMHVQVIYGDKDDVISGNLMMRTSKSIILYVQKDNKYLEIGESQLKNISYIRNNEWLLPETTFVDQIKQVRFF